MEKQLLTNEKFKCIVVYSPHNGQTSLTGFELCRWNFWIYKPPTHHYLCFLSIWYVQKFHWYWTMFRVCKWDVLSSWFDKSYTVSSRFVQSKSTTRSVYSVSSRDFCE